jgi:hypothetical protein
MGESTQDMRDVGYDLDICTAESKKKSLKK